MTHDFKNYILNLIKTAASVRMGPYISEAPFQRGA